MHSTLAMQTTSHLLAAARLGLSAAIRAAPSIVSTSPVCQRCGRNVRAVPSTFVRLFARRAKQTTDPPSIERSTRRRPTSSAISSNDSSSTADVKQPAEESSTNSSRAALMQLVAQLPAADVPAAIAALSQRLTSPNQRRRPQTEVRQADVEVEVEEESDEYDENGEEEEEEDENEAEYAALRARLAIEGVVRTEAGEEIMSMEEVERQLKEGGEAEDDEDELELLLAEEDGDEGLHEAEEEEAQEWDEEEADERSAELQASTSTSTSSPATSAASSSSSSSRSSSTANTFWIQEHRDGTVTVTEWPFADDDDESDLADSYELNMPHTLTGSKQSAIVGQAIGGEKLSREDVLQLREKDLQEHFTKGSGRGGQKVNKTSNCVHLQHTPTGTIVKCHATRSLAENRRIAREIMQDRLEELVLGPASKNAKRAAKIRKQKAKTRRRAAIKYGEADDAEGNTATVDGTITDERSSESKQ